VASTEINGLASAENRMVGTLVSKSANKSVGESVIRRHMRPPHPATPRSTDGDERVLMLDVPDDALERLGDRAHNQALTLGFCTFNLLECPIGSRT
jgi:hypothetical protein